MISRQSKTRVCRAWGVFHDKASFQGHLKDNRKSPGKCLFHEDTQRCWARPNGGHCEHHPDSQVNNSQGGQGRDRGQISNFLSAVLRILSLCSNRWAAIGGFQRDSDCIWRKAGEERQERPRRFWTGGGKVPGWHPGEIRDAREGPWVERGPRGRPGVQAGMECRWLSLSLEVQIEMHLFIC